MNLIYGYDKIKFDNRRFDDYCDGFDEYEDEDYSEWDEDMTELFRERIAELFD